MNQPGGPQDHGRDGDSDDDERDSEDDSDSNDAQDKSNPLTHIKLIDTLDSDNATDDQDLSDDDVLDPPLSDTESESDSNEESFHVDMSYIQPPGATDDAVLAAPRRVIASPPPAATIDAAASQHSTPHPGPPDDTTEEGPIEHTRASRSIRKRKVISGLNSCLCGDVVGVEEREISTLCSVKGCETQWVSIFLISS